MAAYWMQLWPVLQDMHQLKATYGERTSWPTLDEIMRINPDDLLLLRQGQYPLVVGKIRYYAEREFVGLYDPA